MSSLPITLVVGDDDAITTARGRALVSARADEAVVQAPPAWRWPFLHPLTESLPTGPVVIWAPDAHLAVESRQPAHTRLVTTQAGYLFAEWAASLAGHGDARMVATLRHDVVLAHAPEILQQRGLFSRVTLEVLAPATATGPGEPDLTGDTGADRLAAALRQPAAPDRLRACVDALGSAPTPAALVATASVCQEVNDLEGARRDLDEALALAPAWAAPHFERGKVWLRMDDMEAAAGSFREATARLPEFGGAWGNLGAALGELDRPSEALHAFERLLVLDPSSPQAHNNIGVVCRELGRLPESEAAFRRVIALEPNLAFGYYNLGHTLFLQGRYHAAASAYGQGQGRDPEHNPVQGTRLALCRLATGDAGGALSELQRASGALPRDQRRQVLADTSAVLWALITQKPDLTGWQGVHEWLTGELTRLA